MQQEAQLKYCLYARKSSESDERQALSIDSQIKEMEVTALSRGIKVIEIKRESHSAKASGLPPKFNELLTEIRSGKYDAILTWAPDRLSRNAGDLGSLVDLIDSGKLMEICTPTQTFTNNPNDKFLLMILCSQAKLENDNRAKNVLRGMKNKCEMGWRPCKAPLGYLNEKYADRGSQKIYIDPVRGPVISEMFEKCAFEGQSGRELMSWANNERHFHTRNDKKLTLSMVYNILKNPFYYGEFEYPLNSGKFWKGSHEPLITKEVFTKARERLAVPMKSAYGEKKFAYTGILRCGHCGHGITATERVKVYKNGKTMRYVYYHCANKNKTKDECCKSMYLREDRLTEQLLSRLDLFELDEKRLTEKVAYEVKRFNTMRSAIIGGTTDVRVETGKEELLNFLRFTLTSGTIEDKRDIMRYVTTPLIIKAGKLEFSSSQS